MLLLGSIRSIMRGCIANSIFRKPTRPSLPLRKAPHLSPSLSSLRKRGCNRPTVLNFLPLRLSCKESSTFSPSPSSSGSGDVTALRCSEPLRSKVGGASKPCASYAGWDRLITTCFWSSPSCAGWDRRGWEVYNLQFIINSLLFRANSL